VAAMGNDPPSARRVQNTTPRHPHILRFAVIYPAYEYRPQALGPSELEDPIDLGGAIMGVDGVDSVLVPLLWVIRRGRRAKVRHDYSRGGRAVSRPAEPMIAVVTDGR